MLKLLDLKTLHTLNELCWTHCDLTVLWNCPNAASIFCTIIVNSWQLMTIMWPRLMGHQHHQLPSISRSCHTQLIRDFNSRLKSATQSRGGFTFRTGGAKCGGSRNGISLHRVPSLWPRWLFQGRPIFLPGLGSLQGLGRSWLGGPPRSRWDVATIRMAVEEIMM